MKYATNGGTEWRIMRIAEQITGQEIKNLFDLANEGKIFIKGLEDEEVEEITYQKGLLFFKYTPYEAEHFLKEGFLVEVSRTENKNPTFFIFDEDGYLDENETDKYNNKMLWAAVCRDLDEVVPW